MIIYGNIVEEDGLKPGILEFEDGVIKRLIRKPQSPRNDLFDEYGSFIDRHFLRTSHIIFPGFVDLGAYCDFGQETYQSAAVAALNGGITALADISDDPRTEALALEITHLPPNFLVTASVDEFLGIADPIAITPHHLYFNSDMHNKSEYLRTNPPLPTAKEQLRLFDCLGVFDYLVSGHVPHLALDKIRSGLCGVPSLDTFGSFVAWLVQEKKVDVSTVFNIACKNPGKRLGEFTDRKIGRLQPGYEASFTAIDITKTADSGRPIMSKAGWSPFDLRYLTGVVDVVYGKGEKLVDGAWLQNFARIS
jgi:dihydroorotase-like cyclic amidohydrolase